MINVGLPLYRGMLFWAHPETSQTQQDPTDMISLNGIRRRDLIRPHRSSAISTEERKAEYGQEKSTRCASASRRVIETRQHGHGHRAVQQGPA